MGTEVYTGHIAAMRADNEFLGAEDIIEKGDVPVQIVECLRHTNRKACGNIQKEMYTLKLTTSSGPCKKEFWLKATNRKQIAKLYGANVGAWRGKWIWLYVAEVRAVTGGQTLGVRIRDKTDPPPPPKPAIKAPVSSAPKTASAFDGLAAEVNAIGDRDQYDRAYQNVEAAVIGSKIDAEQLATLNEMLAAKNESINQ